MGGGYSAKNTTNHNAESSLEQQTTYYSYTGSRFLLIFLFTFLEVRIKAAVWGGVLSFRPPDLGLSPE